jgi:hypothetical protein
MAGEIVMTTRIPRIAVCVPTRDLTAAEFTHSLVKMVGRFCTHFVGKGQAEIIELFDLGTLLPEMRNTLARKAIEMEATHILWLDSDMIFPEDMIERLYQHGKPIVAASYSQRKEPAKPVAAKDAVWVYTEENSSGIEKVDFVGMGAMLVETAVYEAMDEPWHCLGWNEAKGTIVGEDVYFCRKAAEIGAETWIDHDLSKEIGHIGYRTFTYRDALEARPALLEKQGADGKVPTHQAAE